MCLCFISLKNSGEEKVIDVDKMLPWKFLIVDSKASYSNTCSFYDFDPKYYLNFVYSQLWLIFSSVFFPHFIISMFMN